MLISVIPIIQSLGMQYNYLLQKHLEFDAISKIEIVGRFINFLVSVLLAFAGLVFYYIRYDNYV